MDRVLAVICLFSFCMHFSPIEILIHVIHFPSTDTIWSIVQVADTGTLALTQQLAQLRTNNMNEVATIPKQTFEVRSFSWVSINIFGLERLRF